MTLSYDFLFRDWRKSTQKAKLWPSILLQPVNLDDTSHLVLNAKLPTQAVDKLSVFPQNLTALTLTQLKRTQLNATFTSPNYLALNPENLPRFLPFLTITTPTVVAASLVPAVFRHSSIAQILFAQTLRRALILLHGLSHTLYLKGVISNFGPIWRRVNTPSHEYYPAFFDNSWVYDIGLKLPKFRTENNITQQLKNVLTTATTVIGNTAQTKDINDAVGDNLKFFLQKSSDLPAHKTLYRYSFTWLSLACSLQNPHGFVKKKKARSIKKRLAKKLTSNTLRRFWVL